MIYSKLIPYGEIIKKLEAKESIAVVSCNTCARECGVGGLQKADELVERLTRDGFVVKEELVVSYACSEPMYRKARIRLQSDVVIVLACSAGFNCLARMYPKKTVLKVTEDMGLFITDTELEIFKVVIPSRIPLPPPIDEVGREYELGVGALLLKRRIRLEA